MASVPGALTQTFDDVFLVAGARTPFVDYNGALSPISPTDLGIKAGRAALARADVDPASVGVVVAGNMAQASFDAYFLPRHVGLYAGVNPNVPAVLVQRLCGTGFETILNAADQITLGKAGVVPGYPGDEVCPPQPMLSQTRFVLEKYKANGGAYHEAVIPGGHGCMLDHEDEFIAELLGFFGV